MDKESKKEFFLEYSKHQAQLYAYICSLVPSFADADDILQETSLALWENFEKYEKGSNFLAWAKKTAHFRVLRYRQKCSRDRLHFSDEISSLLEDTLNTNADYLQQRIEALQNCMNKLGSAEREIFEKCYSKEMKIKDAAAELGRKIKGFYKTMARLRKKMTECVDNQVKLEAKNG